MSMRGKQQMEDSDLAEFVLEPDDFRLDLGLDLGLETEPASKNGTTKTEKRAESPRTNRVADFVEPSGAAQAGPVGAPSAKSAKRFNLDNLDELIRKAATDEKAARILKKLIHDLKYRSKARPTTPAPEAQPEAKPKEEPQRKPKSPPVVDVMDSMGEDLLFGLPIFTQSPDDCEVAANCTTQSVNLVKVFAASSLEFIHKSALANIEIRLGKAPRFASDDLRKEEEKNILESLPTIQLASPDILDWHIAALPGARRLKAIRSKLRQWVMGFVRQVAGLLVDLRQGFFGQVEWHADAPDKVARYSFFRHVIEHGAEGSWVSRLVRETQDHRTDAATNTWQTVKVSRTIKQTTSEYYLFRLHGEHEHQIYEADAYSLPASNVAQPEWISALIRGLHPQWQKYLRIIAGKMIRETITEKEIDQKKWTEVKEEEEKVTEQIVAQGNMGSPCVALGDLVFCGWSDRDMLGKPMTITRMQAPVAPAPKPTTKKEEPIQNETKKGFFSGLFG